MSATVKNAPVKIALYKTQKAVEVAIGKFHLSAQAVQSEAHVIACSVLHHYAAHKDKRVVDKMLLMFMQAMPEMGRMNALKEWLEAFGPIEFTGTKNEFNYVSGKATRLGEAMKVPFWKYAKAETPYKAIDPAKYLEQVLNKFIADAKETGRDHSAIINALKLIDPEHKPVATKVAKPKALKKAVAARKAKEAATAPKVEQVTVN